LERFNEPKHGALELWQRGVILRENELPIPANLNAIPAARRTTFRSEREGTLKPSDHTRIVQTAFDFAK
jgi:hypothetical protein